MTKSTMTRAQTSMRESKSPRRAVQRGCAAMAFLVLPLAASAQTGATSPTLIVNGQQSSVSIIQVKGRSYVDLEAIARATGGSVSYAGKQVALSIPTAGAVSPSSSDTNSSPAAAASAQASDPGFSKEFLNTGIEAAAALREWHAALASAIQNGYPIAAGSFGAYRAQAQTNLRLASVAAATDSDRNAYQLLSNEFQNMSRLSDRYVDRRANMTYISPDSLENDGLNQRFVACGRSLSAMAASGQFNDDGSCH